MLAVDRQQRARRASRAARHEQRRRPSPALPCSRAARACRRAPRRASRRARRRRRSPPSPRRISGCAATCSSAPAPNSSSRARVGEAPLAASRSSRHSGQHRVARPVALAQLEQRVGRALRGQREHAEAVADGARRRRACSRRSSRSRRGWRAFIAVLLQRSGSEQRGDRQRRGQRCRCGRARRRARAAACRCPSRRPGA